MTIDAVSPHCLEAIKSHGGFRDHQYDDGKHVMTIGYGTTASDVKPLPTHMSEAEAAKLLEHKITKKYLPAVVHALAPLQPARKRPAFPLPTTSARAPFRARRTSRR